MNQFIIKLPENEDLSLLSEESKIAIAQAKGQFPAGALVGTKAVDGYELKLVICNLDKGSFQSSIVALGLDWEILAYQDEVIDQDKILPYMLPWRAYDNDGNEIDPVPETDITGKLQTYAGNKWIY